MNSPAAKYLIASLLEMPQFLDNAFADLPPELLVATPENDNSPLLEHAWHVRDCESDLYGMRILKVLQEDDPYLEPMSVSDWPSERGYLKKPVAQAMQEFRTLRESLVKKLQALPVESLERGGSRADGRYSSVVDLVAELLEHDQDHRKKTGGNPAQRPASEA